MIHEPHWRLSTEFTVGSKIHPANRLSEGQAIPMEELKKLAMSAGGMPVGDASKIAATELPSISNVSSGGGSFSATLGQMISEVGAKSAASSQAVEGLISGQNVSLHQTMIAMEEASLSFQLMVEVRNKLLESYQELMRMQV